MNDLISRQAAIDAPEEFIKDCNPDHFIGNQKFIEFMDNAEIGSFGNWQFANGFNLGLTAAEVAIKNLPSAQPTLCGYDIEHLILIATVLQKEGLPPERVTDALMDISWIVSILADEFENSLRKAIE